MNFKISRLDFDAKPRIISEARTRASRTVMIAMGDGKGTVDRGGFKIHWAEAPRQFESDSRHIF